MLNIIFSNVFYDHNSNPNCQDTLRLDVLRKYFSKSWMDMFMSKTNALVPVSGKDFPGSHSSERWQNLFQVCVWILIVFIEHSHYSFLPMDIWSLKIAP